MITLRLIKQGTDWKARRVGYHRYLVEGRCYACGQPHSESVQGTPIECRAYALTNRFLCQACQKKNAGPTH